MGPLVAVLLQNMPQIIQLGRDLFVDANPGAPPPTDEQVIGAWIQAATSTLLKDEQWLAAHGGE